MLIAFHLLIQTGLIVRAVLRPNREPTSRLTWIVVILVLPVVGILTYLLLGEPRMGRSRMAQHWTARARLPRCDEVQGGAASDLLPDLPDRQAVLFRVGQSISGFAPVGGNAAA